MSPELASGRNAVVEKNTAGNTQKTNGNLNFND